MPGLYGAVSIVIGRPSMPKPVKSGLCVVCRALVYRQTFSVGQGWCWRHPGCDPIKGVVERRRNRAGHAYGYVPKQYEGGTGFDPALGAAIAASRRD